MRLGRTMSNDLGYCRGARAEKTAQLVSKQNQLLQQQRDRLIRPPPAGKASDILERMRLLDEAMAKDKFAKHLDKSSAVDKDSPDYGRPLEGTRTAARGAKAHKHVHKEILELCEVIYTNGFEQPDHTSVIFFGDLFRMYTRISDKVVGLLLRARKYGLVYFEPEILFQGQDEDTPVCLTKPMQEIYFMYNNAGKSFVRDED